MIFNETVASSKRLFRYSYFVRFPGGFCELAVLTNELDQKTVSLAIMSEFFLYVLRHTLYFQGSTWYSVCPGYDEECADDTH